MSWDKSRFGAGHPVRLHWRRALDVGSQTAGGSRLSFARIGLVACLACFTLYPGLAEAWQPPREPRPKRKPASSGSSKKTPRPAARPKQAEDDTEERGKLKELKAEQPLRRLRDMQTPTVEQLHASPVDWILLKGPNKDNEQVIVVKQVFPRPDTLQKLQAALDKLRKQPAPTSREDREKRAVERNELSKLVVALPGETEGQLYEIPTNLIDYIIYHEDLIVRRSAALIAGAHFRDAFELLYPLSRQYPKWPGVKEQTERLLYLEGERALKAGDFESAVTSLDELDRRNRDYPELQAMLGQAFDRIIASREADRDFRAARHFLGRLARIEPKHEIVGKWTRALGQQAQDLIQAASNASRAGRHDEAVTLIDRAARVWPKTPGLDAVHQQLADRYQRLDVGVQNVASPGAALEGAIAGAAYAPWAMPADSRQTHLTQFDLFEVDRIDDTTHYKSRLFEQWEPTDLGRGSVFTLKATRARWESRPILTASDVLSSMEMRLDRTSPLYDERLAGCVESLRLRSPFEFEVGFSRAPPRVELLFRFPVAFSGETAAGSAAAGSPSDPGAAGGGMSGAGGLSAEDGSRSGRVLSSRFQRVSGAGSTAIYRRVIPQPDGLAQYHLAEIEEHRYDLPERAVQGLLRGEVSLLPDLPTWAVSLVREDTRFFVLSYAVPTTHVLQLNPESEVLNSREMRLAIAYAIDARRILSRTVLRDSTAQRGRLSTAPFATTSYAYNSLVTPREPSPGMAASLRAAAARRLKAIPVLRVVCEPETTARAAAAEIISQWKRVGIKAELITADSTSPQSRTDWDVAYRTLRMEEPLVEIWPFLTAGGGARLAGVRHLPDWMRAELLDLDNAADWRSAVARLQQLQAHLYAEVACIPLYETDDALVLRKNVRAFPAVRFVHPYQDVERWIVQSWYPEDEP